MGSIKWNKNGTKSSHWMDNCGKWRPKNKLPAKVTKQVKSLEGQQPLPGFTDDDVSEIGQPKSKEDQTH